MFEILTTVLLCNTGRDLTCLSKNLEVIQSTKTVIVCEKRGECERRIIKN